MLAQGATSIVAAAVGMVLAGPAQAQQLRTLNDALALTYATNPALLAARAQLRVVDENVPQALAGWRPTVTFTANAGYIDGTSQQYIRPTAVTPGRTVESQSLRGSNVQSLTVTQPLFRGGTTSATVNFRENQVLAQRATLIGAEQTAFTNAVQAYVGVIQSQQVLALSINNEQVLARQLQATQERFRVGEITRTDVAQSESRLAQSEADLANARAQLSVSRAAYAAVVGQAPGELAPMPALPGVPADFDTALDVALSDNPAILSAAYTQRAAEAQVAAAKAEYMPSASLTASYGGGTSDLGQLGDIADQTRFQAGASLSVPLFTGGLNRSRVAQAVERANVAQINLEGERRNILQAVSSAFAQSISSRATLQAGEEAVRAATVAAEGVRQEAQVGLRTTLDVLNQELELRNAQINLASARRNEYVAQASLLAAMGRLEGADLDADLTAYDPAANYNRVRNRGGLPWDGVVEAIDRIASPAVMPANNAADAPIDSQLNSEIVGTAPRD